MSSTQAFVFAALTAGVYLVFRTRKYGGIHLRGPPSPSVIYGTYKQLYCGEPSEVYDSWASEYGGVFRVPSGMGQSFIALCDPRAAAHFLAEETWTFRNSPWLSKIIERLFGKGLSWAEAESHKQRKKAMSPAFSSTAVRHLTPIFFDSAYKVKAAWDAILDPSPASSSSVIEVSDWITRFTFDNIGITGFSHDFGALSGTHLPILEVLAQLRNPASSQSKVDLVIFLLSLHFPVLMALPTKLNRALRSLNGIMGHIVDEVLDKARRTESGQGEKSIIGLLVKSEDQAKELGISKEEVLAHMNELLFAGFELTSIALTWAFIELCKDPSHQSLLRHELASLGSNDPTHEQLMIGLPYLDAFVLEVMRLHPVIAESVRVAVKDDVIPLSQPILTREGEWMSSVLVKKGDELLLPIRYFNRSTTFWGPDAAEFNPSRWQTAEDGVSMGAKEITGHRKLLTFSSGPRMCPGKQFLLVEVKVALSVLVKHFEFAFEKGVDGTNIGDYPTVIPRPKIQGEQGSRVPLLVRRHG